MVGSSSCIFKDICCVKRKDTVIVGVSVKTQTSPSITELPFFLSFLRPLTLCWPKFLICLHGLECYFMFEFWRTYQRYKIYLYSPSKWSEPRLAKRTYMLFSEASEIRNLFEVFAVRTHNA